MTGEKKNKNENYRGCIPNQGDPTQGDPTLLCTYLTTEAETQGVAIPDGGCWFTDLEEGLYFTGPDGKRSEARWVVNCDACNAEMQENEDPRGIPVGSEIVWCDGQWEIQEGTH